MDTSTTTQVRRIFAHRGTTLLAPENTIAAFDLAIEYQSDVLETDVRISKDGVVIVTHDETLERTTNGTGNVREHTVKQLKKLDASSAFRDLNGQPYSGSTLRLLTLSEMFQHYPNVGINIDIKDDSIDAAEAVASVIKQHQGSTGQWVNVGSFNAAVIQHFRKIAPQVNTAATRQEVARLVFGPAKNLNPAYQVLQIPTAYWGISLNRSRLIRKAQSRGCEMVYWTINEAEEMQRLLERGCNGIVSDRPDVALDVFKKLGMK